MKHMVLSDGVAYVEAPEVADFDENACEACALFRTELCGDSYEPSVAAFGADCIDRAVIYIKADPQPQKVEG